MSVELDGRRVQALREMRVLERRELAERCGISYSTLSQIETDRRRARAETVKRLADALAVHPEDLVRRLKVAERLRALN